ncbi:hypothetical protein [Pseudonocardia acaciae]|uniref:hypothetical protein n=1 Tax=Pseudonocardia acaciae TaxID=551276 RepID=UPI00048BF2DB|nr:hypothetical protein [Pseudonocardia acaciae]
MLDIEGNMLMYGGVSLLWECALGNTTVPYLSPANAAIGVGDGTAAESATQNDLTGANKLRKGMAASFPAHTDGLTVTANAISFRSTFATGDANWAWQEAGVFNTATLGAGRMLNRKVAAMGTKTAASSWQITFDITIT